LPAAVNPPTILIAGVPDIVMADSSVALDATMQGRPALFTLLEIVKSPLVDKAHAGELEFTYATACVLKVGNICVKSDAM
jgi:hypothetical protein